MSNPSGAVGVTTHPVGGFPQQPWRVEKRPLVRPLGPGGGLEVPLRCDAVQVVDAAITCWRGKKRTVQDICHKNQPLNQRPPTQQQQQHSAGKLPSSRVLRQSSRLAAQSPIPLPGPQFSNHFEKTYLQVMRGFVMDFCSWICNGRPPGKKEEI